jgi:hypothetical protein
MVTASNTPHSYASPTRPQFEIAVDNANSSAGRLQVALRDLDRSGCCGGLNAGLVDGVKSVYYERTLCAVFLAR